MSHAIYYQICTSTLVFQTPMRRRRGGHFDIIQKEEQNELIAHRLPHASPWLTRCAHSHMDSFIHSSTCPHTRTHTPHTHAAMMPHHLLFPLMRQPLLVVTFPPTLSLRSKHPAAIAARWLRSPKFFSAMGRAATVKCASTAPGSSACRPGTTTAISATLRRDYWTEKALPSRRYRRRRYRRRRHHRQRNPWTWMNPLPEE